VRTRRELHDGWTLRAGTGPVPADVVDVLTSSGVRASVPGCVHTDLLAAGLIPDPLLDQNEALVEWVSRVEWVYDTTFDWDDVPSGSRIVLVAEGLDTVATVRLGDVVVLESANMHRTYRVDLSELLTPGRHQLSITFASPLAEVDARSAAQGPRPHVNPQPFNALRKNASSFGWDWGPAIPSSGIWQALALETWHTARLAEVRPEVTVADGRGRVAVHCAVDRLADIPLTARLTVDGLTTEVAAHAGDLHVDLAIDVAEPRLWWPRSHGSPELYDVVVTLEDADHQILDVRTMRVGFRTVEVDSTADDDGTAFGFRVNGVPVFARGVNWIPDHVYLARLDRERYAERLRQAADVNVNLVRVWGGGLYESDHFYDVCDELGLLVWQDFAFACASYPEEPLLAEVEAEAREAVVRLASHPSLALWCGGNECLWGYEDWDWKEPLAGRTWGSGFYYDLLPAVVAELDPTRAYVPGSPFSPDRGRHPNDPDHGPMHIWDVWNTRDYADYREYVPRFVSEFGFQGPPTWATLTRAVHDEPLAPDSPAMLSHQKAEDGNGKLERGLAGHLATPATFDDWHWATSLNQARAVATGIEHFRSWSPRCQGAVLWQHNDCWPVTSWSIVDGDGRLKPAWYAVRRAFADRLLTVQPRESRLAVVLVNDSSSGWAGDLVVSRRRYDGETLASRTIPVVVAARTTVALPVPRSTSAPADAGDEVLVAELDDDRALWHFADGIESSLAPPQVDAVVEGSAEGHLVTVVAHTFVRDLALLVERVRVHAVVDDQLVSLFPGESVTFRVTGVPDGLADQLLDPLVLRSANQLGASIAPASRAG
jgi:beta-mannosidase